jgi:hypothetical protein
MKFQFTRTGNKPTSELIQFDGSDGTSTSTALRNCFAFCGSAVRRQLDRFIEDKAQRHVSFDFGDNQVEVTKWSED